MGWGGKNRQRQISGRGRGLAAQVEEMDFFQGLAEEVGPEVLEFFNRVGGVEGAGWLADGGGDEVGEAGGDGVCGGVGRIDDGERVAEGGEYALDGGLQEWVMSASKEESLSCRGGGEGLGEVNLQDVVGDGVVDPALFYQGNQEGAGLFVGCEAEKVEGASVGAGLDRGSGGEDEDVVDFI